MLRTIILVVIVAAFGTGVANAQQKVEVKGQSSKVKLNQVISGHLSELNGKYQLRVSETTFEPGGSVSLHQHAGPGIRCITVGELTNVALDGKTTTNKAGTCYYESGDVSHSARNATDKPTVLLVYEILPASLSGGSAMPVPAPK
jgi:quercetin dioxygenase-like cupin family protein